ncbi:chemotaxis protein CheW, partial [Enterococcus hirae]
PEEADGFLTAMTRFAQRTVQIVDVERVLVEIGGGGAGAASAPATPLNGWRVLVADDSVVARRQVEETVRSLGLECV